jgi:hypothetical protein
MIALRVKRNGKELCVAGAEDLSVLNTIINAVGAIGNKTRKIRDGARDLHLSVGGLTRRKSGADFHLRWVEFQELAIGDKIEVELVETSVADAPTAKHKADRARRKARK